MIYSKDETRENVADGAKILYEAVKTTLGPKGQNVLIKTKFGEFKITHDGVTVAKATQLGDDPRSVGADLLRDASLKMEEIGDGTTSVTVLAYNLMVELNKLIDNGENAMQLKRRLEALIDPLMGEVDKLAKPVGDSEQAIYDVALISTGGDEELAKIITRVMIDAGLDSLIAVEETSSALTTGSVAEGYAFDNGFLSPHMITEKETRSAILERPGVVYVAGGISRVEDMVKLFNGVAEAGHREVLFVVESIADDPLDMVIFNNIKKNIKATVVKAPGFDNDQCERMLDMAALTGGGVIDTSLDDWADYLVADNFGKAKRVVVKAHDTLILEDGNRHVVTERVELIRGLAKKENDDVAQAKLTQRLAALTGGVGVIKVGGVNPSEVTEKKYRVDDAIGAVRAAMEGGIVAGAGSTLREVAFTLEDGNFNEAVKQALLMPEATLIENSGGNAGKLQYLPKLGYDVNNDREVDLLEKGIVDPAIVTKEVIRNAFTVAGMAITVGGSIVEKKLSQEELMQLMGAQA